MIPLNLVVNRLPPSSFKSPFRWSPKSPPHTFFSIPRKSNQTTRRNGFCKAAFSQDAPFAVAIGSCILNSLIFQTTPTQQDEDDQESNSAIDSADTRFAVMGIISFIPYFNWLSWVFAWTDTAKRRYAVYALVYLAPYFRSNLSLSPEDSWLPIASIIACILHVQLEASIKNGDLQSFQLFSGVKDLLGKKDGAISSKERRKDHQNLPSAQEQSRNKIDGWRVPRKTSPESENLNQGEVDDDGRDH